MIIDLLSNARLYNGLGAAFTKAFEYLQRTDCRNLEKGKYEIDGSRLFAIVNEYDTVPTDHEQMEAHRKYIDVQYIVRGAELIGHDFLCGQTPSKDYDEAADYMLFGDKPAFFSKLQEGYFAIFFPTDLHMPNVMVDKPEQVKKVVIKIAVD